MSTEEPDNEKHSSSASTLFSSFSPSPSIPGTATSTSVVYPSSAQDKIGDYHCDDDESRGIGNCIERSDNGSGEKGFETGGEYGEGEQGKENRLADLGGSLDEDFGYGGGKNWGSLIGSEQVIEKVNKEHLRIKPLVIFTITIYRFRRYL